MLTQEWNDTELSRAVEKALRRLHISGNLKGFWYLHFDIIAVVKDYHNLQGITKRLYRDTARYYAKGQKAIDKKAANKVERDIRTAIKQCWQRGGRPELDQMAGYHLIRRPTNREFMDLVAAHIRDTR